jgi:hypothetical protein
MWLGPPTRTSKIQLRSRSFEAPAAFWASKAGRDRPNIVSDPTWRKSRRLRPSQKLTERSPSSRNMLSSPSIERRGR